jgi:Icc-related predicted phosphoesterase
MCDHGERVGCNDLLARVKQLPNLKLHVFGHIHESYGVEELEGGPMFVNASSCTLSYNPTSKPIVVEI